MAYNFLTLVNEVHRRLNEVELTTSNFTGIRGQSALNKDAVNASIRHINQAQFEWPWNHAEATEVLTEGVVRYSYPYDAKSINMDSFRLKRDDALGVDSRKLKVLDYEEYLDKYVDYEYNSSTGVRAVPHYIVRSPSRELLFVPSPDKAYEVVYEYYVSSFDLQKADDVPSIPEQYRHVIVDGAMYYAYLFRGDNQAANTSMAKFDDGIKDMRSLNINRTEYLRDTRVRF